MEEQSGSIPPIPSFRSKGRGWMPLVLVGTALLFTSCQSDRRASPPPQQPVAAPVQPQRAIRPAQWKTEAEHWLGVKYRKGGMDRTGVDCSGLAFAMYLAVTGISLPRTSEDQFRYGNLVSFNELRPGDLVFFTSLNQRVVDHVGIYLGDTQFVHASASKGVVVSSFRQDYYAKRFHAAKRIIP